MISPDARCTRKLCRLRTNSEELLPTSLEETLRVMADDGRVNVTRGRWVLLGVTASAEFGWVRLCSTLPCYGRPYIGLLFTRLGDILLCSPLPARCCAVVGVERKSCAFGRTDTHVTRWTVCTLGKSLLFWLIFFIDRCCARIDWSLNRARAITTLLGKSLLCFG